MVRSVKKYVFVVPFTLSRVVPKLKHKAEVHGRLSVSVRHSVRQPFEGLALLYLTTVANLSYKLS